MRGLLLRLDKRQEEQIRVILEEVLETVLSELDKQMLDEKVFGGTTAVVALFLGGFVALANTGDSTAVQVINGKRDFVTEPHNPGDWTRLGSQKERIRLQYMAKARPELLDATTNPGVPGGGPKGVQWMRQVLVPDSVKDGHGDKGKVIRNKSDVGTMCLGLDCDSDEPQQMEVHEGMVGRRSMIWGGSLDPDGISKCGKLFDTIAMSRCLGDHDKAWMKPFLIPVPDVDVKRLGVVRPDQLNVVILASDGLWDAVEFDTAIAVCSKHFKNQSDGKQWTRTAARELVGLVKQISEDGHANTDFAKQIKSNDDVTVWIIPIWQHMTTGLESHVEAPMQQKIEPHVEASQPAMAEEAPSQNQAEVDNEIVLKLKQSQAETEKSDPGLTKRARCSCVPQAQGGGCCVS